MNVSERRLYFRQGLCRFYLSNYDRLCAVLPPEWQPYFGLRTFSEQTLLWGKGRTIAPIGLQYILTQAKSGESPHNYGCASDWTLWDTEGKPIWLNTNDPRWKTYQEACIEAGVRWGGDWNGNRLRDEKFIDDPHNELRISCDWKHVAAVYSGGGMRTAMQHIGANLL